jgi:hypothetical protein
MSVNGEPRFVNNPENAAAADSDATSEVILPVGPERQPVAATELLRAEARDVHANELTMERSGAETITAERLVMTNSGARTVEARSAQIDNSGILAVKSEKAVFQNATVLAAATSEARVVRSNVFLLKADEVTVEGDTRIGVLAGPGCNGVKPMFDVKGALALGAGVGMVLATLNALARGLFKRR